MNNSEKFWDKAAISYDKEEKKDEHTYWNIIEKTRKHLKVSDIVLDYGCGTGLISNEIAGNVKMIHALDISSKMIEIAINKAMCRKIKNIDYKHSTIFDERYKKSSFDVILIFYVLHLLDDTDKVIQRIHELLKPGGLMISVTPCMGKKKFLNSILSMVSKIGIIPKIKPFKIYELEDSITEGNFEIIEKECLHQSSQEYYIVAKKIESV